MPKVFSIANKAQNIPVAYVNAFQSKKPSNSEHFRVHLFATGLLHPVSNRFKYHFMMNIPQALNLHKRLELDHGQMTLIQVREWEKLERLSARFRNNLHFTLHCKHRNVTPVSLRVKTCVKGEPANSIIHRTQIGQSNYGLTLNKLQQKLFHLY